MDYFEIGDEIDYNKYNGLVYLLRKFKRLRTSIKLGEKNIIDKFGTYRFIGDFTNINGNFILEEDINIYANDVFKNAQYQFTFNAINQDTSEEINRHVIYKSGDTGDDGILNITLPEDMVNENEVILPEVIIDIFFSTHEYQNGLNSFKTSLTVQHRYLESGTNKITLTILDEDDTPVDDILTTIYINGVPHQVTTNSNGKAEYNYQYTGTAGKVEVRSNGETAVFFDGGINFLYNEFSSKTEFPPDYYKYKYEMELGYNSQYNNGEAWLKSNDVVKFNCVEDTYQIFLDNPKSARTFKGSITSSSQLTGIHWTITGDVTAIGPDMFNSCFGLKEIFIPRGIEKINRRAFYYAKGLKSIDIPDTVYVIGDSCFYGSGLEEIKIPASINSIGGSAFDKCKIETYELSWTENQIIPYNKNKFPVIEGTIFKIPFGETDNYIAKNYPAERLVEQNVYLLTLETTNPIIGTGLTASATALLTVNGEPAVDEELGYVIKHDSTVISTGTATTNSNGEATISYTGTGAGEIEIIVSYDDLEESVNILDTKMYADNTAIHTWSTSSLSDSVNYNSSYTVQNGETVYYKVSSSPTKYVFGFVQGNSYCQLQKNGNNIYLYVNGQSAPSVSGSLTTNDVIKFEKVSDTEQKVYINDNLIATFTNHSMSAPQPMVRVYNNDSFTMKYVYVI